MNIGEQIQEFRKKSGLSQSDLAQKVGISRNALYNYENNKRAIPVPLLIKISAVLNIGLEDLLGEISKNNNQSDLQHSVPSVMSDFAPLFVTLKACNITIKYNGDNFLVIFLDERDERGVYTKALLEKTDLLLLNDILKASTINTVKAFIKNKAFPDTK